MTEAGFELDGVGVRSSERDRLVDVTVSIPARGVTVLTGPSGSGKSTLLRLLNRLDVPTSGSISWRGTSLDDVDVMAHRRDVGMVFQRPTALPGTVADNIRAGDPAQIDTDVVGLLEMAALDASFAERDASRLSGGELQRVCLARTLATGPRIVLADEPTSSLDEASTAALEEVVRRLADPDAKRPVAWVWVSHDRGQTQRLADRVIRLDAGRIVAAES